MTPETIAARFFFFIIALAGLGVVCCGWRAYNRDAFRQRAFAIRDELFDFAANGSIAFNDPAYTLLRSRMNATIQYSHRLTFGEAFLPLLFMILRNEASDPPRHYVAWEKAVAKHPKETRDALNEFNNRFASLLASHLMRNTPVAWPILLLIAVGYGLTEAVKEVRKRITTIEEEAVEDAGLAAVA
jgi:hypothetical protein